MNANADAYARTPPELMTAEAELQNRTGSARILWYGRAAVGLYRAYQLARRLCYRESAEVILPAMSCATPANAAMLAGLRPRFADVNPETGMPDLAEIERCYNENTCAVVFIHLYGQTADLDAVAKWTQARNILLIEDVAQAQGALLPNGRSAGGVGDAAAYSFNPTKLLECGGGALAVRAAEHARMLDELSREDPLPALPAAEDAAQLSLSYRNLHHSLVGLLRRRTTTGVSEAFLKIRAAYDSLYLKPLNDPAALAESFPRLNGILERRRRKAEIYQEALAGGPWLTLDGWRESGVCWRYALLVDFPERATEFSEKVRRDGFHVSNLYWPVNQFFNPDDACPAADAFARRVVNLWVDDSVDEDWVRRCAASLLKHAACEA